MKATCTTSVIANCFFPVILMILTVICTCCSENPTWSSAGEEVSYDNGNIITEFFTVYPAGTTIHAFGVPEANRYPWPETTFYTY